MVNLISRLYGIKVESIEPFDGGFSSNNWIVTDADGVRFFLKEMPFKNIDRIKFLNEVQNYLYDNGFSIPVLMTTNGNGYFIMNNAVFVLYKYVQGERIEKTHDKASAYFWGTYLGKVHQLLKEYDTDNIIKAAFTINKPQIPYLKQIINDNIFDGIAREIAEYKRYRLENYLYKIPDVHSWKTQIVHGDFYLNNIIKSGKNMFLIDFERTSYFYQEYEIMRAAIMIGDFKFNGIDTENVISYLIDFIKGYLEYGYIQCDFYDLVDFYDYMQLNDLYYLKKDTEGKDILFFQRKYDISKWLYLFGTILKEKLSKEFIR